MQLDKIIILSGRNYQAAKRLITHEPKCMNYDSVTGGCLRLDDGTVVPCLVLAEHRLNCYYFKNVLLNDKAGIPLRDELFRPENAKICKSCGKPFVALSNRAMYCSVCSKKNRRAKQNEWRRTKYWSGK